MLISFHLAVFVLNFALCLVFFGVLVYLEDELVGLAQLGRVLLKLLVLFNLLLVRCVEQQLLDVSGLQPVSGHVHQDLTQLRGGELQMGDQDGCREEEEEGEEEEGEVGEDVVDLNFFSCVREDQRSVR